jgi:hypothetical protein
LRKSLILRAATAAVVSISITFIQAHNALVGLVAVLAFATGIMAAEIWQALSSDDRQVRGTIIRMSAGSIIISGIVGTAGLDLLTVMSMNVVFFGYAFFAIEVFRAVRAGWRERAGRDHLVVALVHFLMTALFVCNLTSLIVLGEVPAVGFVGGYAAILAVLWGLRAFDPKQPS